MADEITPQQPNLVEQYAQSVNQRKLEAEAQMQKLIDSLNIRKNMPFDPVLMGLARGLLSPTKTGSFGESLGYGLGAASEEAQKRAAQDVDVAKMEFELRQKQAEQQQAADAMKFRMQYFGGTPQAAAAPAAPPLTAAFPIEAKQLTAVPQMSTARAPALLPEDMPKTPPPAAPAAPTTYTPRFSESDFGTLAVVDPFSAEVAAKIEEQRRKNAEIALREREITRKERITQKVGGVEAEMSPRDYDRVLEAIDQDQYDVAKRIYNRYGLFFPFVQEDGKLRRMSPSEEARQTELGKAIEAKPYPIPEVGGTIVMLPEKYVAYQKAVEEGKGQEWVDKNILRKGAAGEPSKAEVKPQLTEEERVAEQKRRERKAEEQAKSEVKSRDEIISNAKTAMIIEKPAAQIFKIASDPIGSKALGLLENPDVFSAVAGVTADGVQIGPFRMGIPAVREAVAKVTGDPKEREQILNSLQMLSRNYSEIELNFTRLYLKGEGAVTEGERAIVRQVAGGVGNRRVVALAQTETLLQRAAFDKAVKTELLRWEKENPNKSIDEFTESAGYKKLYNELDRNTNAIYDKYFGGKKESKAEPRAAEPKPTSAAPAGSLRERIDAAKKARGL